LLSDICEQFNCLPSEAEKELVGDVLEITRVRSYQRIKEIVEDENTTEETLKRFGLSTHPLVDIIFENIERGAKDG